MFCLFTKSCFLSYSYSQSYLFRCCKIMCRDAIFVGVPVMVIASHFHFMGVSFSCCWLRHSEIESVLGKVLCDRVQTRKFEFGTNLVQYRWYWGQSGFHFCKSRFEANITNINTWFLFIFFRGGRNKRFSPSFTHQFL